MRTSRSLCLVFGVLSLAGSAAADSIPAILRGKVIMRDGSPPPFTVGIQRICSDGYGSAPGPLTNKKGEFIWRMDFDFGLTRVCHLEATHDGFQSTGLDISRLNPTDPNITLDPIVMFPNVVDPYSINTSDKDVPSKSRQAWKAAIEALTSNNRSALATQLQAAVDASPKFARGWQALGVVYERLGKYKEAADAYQHAIDADPKLLTSYVTMTRLCLKQKDWQGAVKFADDLIKADRKNEFPDIHMHRAVALYETKDLAGAQMSVEETIRLDKYHGTPRAEYVLGRILEAKGDLNGAREHMNAYVKLDPNARDLERIQKHVQALGTPQAADIDPELELF
jgi:regulator of sirC expression with transglutaminase-like and TPR domain